MLDETMAQPLDRKTDLVFGAYSAFVENLTLIVHDLRSFFRSSLPSLTAERTRPRPSQRSWQLVSHSGVCSTSSINAILRPYPSELAMTHSNLSSVGLNQLYTKPVIRSLSHWAEWRLIDLLSNPVPCGSIWYLAMAAPFALFGV
jgi:hypothetical protein